MSKEKITTIEDYQRYFKGTQQYINEMEDIQTDIDYEVSLNQIYSKWMNNSKLALTSNLGPIAVKDYYFTVLKNSGLTSFYNLTYIDTMILKKITQITIEKYTVTPIQRDAEDLIQIDIHLKFSFIENSFVSELNYLINLIIDNTESFDEFTVTNKHVTKCQMNNSFFVEIEKNIDHMLFLINNILPYSFDYYSSKMPALFVDKFTEEIDDESDDIQ